MQGARQGTKMNTLDLSILYKQFFTFRDSIFTTLMHDRFEKLEHLLLPAPLICSLAVWQASQDSLVQVSCGQEAKHPVGGKLVSVFWVCMCLEGQMLNMMRRAWEVLEGQELSRFFLYKFSGGAEALANYDVINRNHCLCAYHHGIVSLSCGVSWCLSMFARW